MNPGELSIWADLANKGVPGAKETFEKLKKQYKRKYMNTEEQERYERGQKALNTFDEYAKRTGNKDEDNSGKIWAMIVGGGLIGTFLAFVIALSTVYSWFANGFVLTKLWAWFIMPFVDKPLTIFHAAGIVIVMSFLTHQCQPFPSWHKEHFSEEYTLGKRCLYLLGMVVGPWVTLLGGYIVHRLM